MNFNIMEKADFIKQEWKKLFPEIESFNLDSGFSVAYCINGISDIPIDEKLLDFHYSESDNIKFRPKSLIGVEDNNGWKKINSINDLPPQGYYQVIGRLSRKPVKYFLNQEFSSKEIDVQLYSHYKIPEVIKLPLY